MTAWRFVAGCALAAVVGCSDDHPTQTFSGEVSIAISAPALNVPRGGSATELVTITREGDYTGTVTLSVTGLPAGLTAAFSQPTVPSTSTSSTLTITASATAAFATTVVTVHANGVAAADATAQLQLTVISGVASARN